MRLSYENSKEIRLGDVVKFTYYDKKTRIGVVYGIPKIGNWGVLCRCTDNSTFGISVGRKITENIEFEILKEHEPVDVFGMYYDFVCNHEND